MTETLSAGARTGLDSDGNGDVRISPSPMQVRYHGLDCLRAAAMLAGVFYHLPIISMGGFGMGGGFGASPKAAIDDWLHSFRMPLFFLISGFFACMVLRKYGIHRYLMRRAWRIGAPLIVALMFFGAIRSFFPSVMQSFGGPMDPAAAMGGFGPPAGAMPWPMGGEGAFPAPSPMPFGPPGQPAFNPQQVFMPGQNGSAAPTGVPAFAMPEMPQPPSRSIADKLFGAYSRNFNLEHLWFLWYLLVFVVISPLVVWAIAIVFSTGISKRADRLAQSFMRLNLTALLLGLISLPMLMLAQGFMGWSLTNPQGFLSPFPDFLFQYHADMPFYFVYFLAGWWLYRLRDHLSDVTRGWQWALVVGIAGFAASRALFNAYGMRAEVDGYAAIRLGGFALYGVGAAYTAFGCLGLFQRFLDRPSRVGRYFADTALWIYLIHLPLIPLVIDWIEPMRCAWWQASIAGMVLVTAIALASFELIVRPTPLMLIFGPPVHRKGPAAVARSA